MIIKSKFLDWFLEALCPSRCIVTRKLGPLLDVSLQGFPPAPANQVRYEYLDDIYARTAYYDSTVEKVVEYFKFRQYQGLSGIMAKAILEQIPEDFIPPGAGLVPIPLHWKRWISRGYNQSLLLARALESCGLDRPINRDLKRLRPTSQQARLNRAARLQNLKGAFSFQAFKIPQTVILIDDVVASGSTLEEAAKTLKKSGVKVVKAIVFARGGKQT